MLNRLQSSPHDVLMLLSCAPPDSLNQRVTQRILLVDCSQVGQFERALNKFAVRVLNVDILKHSLLENPVREVLEVQVSTHVDLPLAQVVLRVALSIFHLVKDVLELCHTLYLFIENG